MTTSAKLKIDLSNPVHFVALGFGSGCSPIAPGTFGTLVAVPLFWLAQGLSSPAYAILVLFMFAIGIWICDRTTRDLGVDDHPAIVWDEVVGFFITMTAAPKDWYWIVMGFVLFRFFDILKPWPVRQADNALKGGFGIMADDVLAGCYAWLVLQILVFIVE